MSRSLKQIDAAGVAAVLAISGLAYVTAVRPAMVAHRERQEMADQIRSETLANREVAERVNELQTALRDERKGLEAYPIRLESMSSLNDRITEVVGLARDCNLTVRATEPGKLERSKLYGVVGLRLEGGGDYRSCTEFLHRLNTEFSDMGVRSMSLISQPQNPYDDPLFNFHLLWFVQLDQPES